MKKTRTCDFCNRHVEIKSYGYNSKIGYMKVAICEECAEKEKDKLWDVRKFNKIKKEMEQKKKAQKSLVVIDWRMERGKKI